MGSRVTGRALRFQTGDWRLTGVREGRKKKNPEKGRPSLTEKPVQRPGSRNGGMRTGGEAGGARRRPGPPKGRLGSTGRRGAPGCGPRNTALPDTYRHLNSDKACVLDTKTRKIQHARHTHTSNGGEALSQGMYHIRVILFPTSAILTLTFIIPAITSLICTSV